jgi:hypothetical protein
VAGHAEIVCTLGPASAFEEKVRALDEAGMDVARLNFSHGDAYHYGFVSAASPADSGVVRGQIRALGADGGLAGFGQCYSEPDRAVSGASKAPFAARSIVAQADSRPPRQVRRYGGRTHVDADLGRGSAE